jgi:hypothetical protein
MRSMDNPFRGCGQAILYETIERGWSKTYAANRLRVSRSTYHRITQDWDWKPDSETINGILKGFGWSLLEFQERGLKAWQDAHPDPQRTWTQGRHSTLTQHLLALLWFLGTYQDNPIRRVGATPCGVVLDPALRGSTYASPSI